MLPSCITPSDVIHLGASGHDALDRRQSNICNGRTANNADGGQEVLCNSFLEKMLASIVGVLPAEANTAALTQLLSPLLATVKTRRRLLSMSVIEDDKSQPRRHANTIVGFWNT